VSALDGSRRAWPGVVSRRRVVTVGGIVAGVVGLTVPSVFAFGGTSPPPRPRSSLSAPKSADTIPPTAAAGTTTTMTPATTTTNTPATPATSATRDPGTTTIRSATTTTSVPLADSLLFIDGTNWTLSDVSESIITTCTAGMPSSIQVMITGGSVTPTGTVDWRLNDGVDQPFQLSAGSVTIPFQCPATVPPSGSVPAAVSYLGDSAHYGSSALAQLGVEAS